MKDFHTEEFFNFFKTHPWRKEYRREYLAYLNNQAWIFMRPFALLAIVAWLWYGFYFDTTLHPDFSELLYFRIGLSVTGAVIFFISFIEKMKKYALAWFLMPTTYLVLSCSFFTGRLAFDPNYVSGLQLIILMIVLGPFTFKTILMLYSLSVILFFTSMNIYDVRLYSYGHKYSMSNLIITYFIGVLAAFIVERLRFLYFAERLKLQEANAKIWSEVEVAKKIQTLLLPQDPKLKDFEIAVYIEPADEVGGDYYDIIHAEGRDWIVIGDVSGHGISAGLIMMMVQTAIKTVLDNNSSLKPSELLNMVNNALLSNIKLIGEGKYMTITVLAYHEKGEFFFSGLHQEMLVYRAEDETVEQIETDGSWLGIEKDILEILTDGKFVLNIDDILFVYTDGLTEAWLSESTLADRIPSRDMYGNEKLVRTFNAVCHKTKSPEDIIRDILRSLDDYSINDDITLMVLRRIH